MPKKEFGQLLSQNNPLKNEDQSPDSSDVDLQELAELIFKKFHEELMLENDRTGRSITGR